MKKRQKPVYESPKIIPLGELIKSTGALVSCTTGTNARNKCVTGSSPRTTS